MKTILVTAILFIYLCQPMTTDAVEETCEIEHCEEECQEGQGILMEKTYELLTDVCDKSNSLMEIMQCNLGKTSQFAASSCQDIARVNPDSPSGEYWITNSNGTATKVFCTMVDRFGTTLTVPKGLMRVAYIDGLQLESEGCPEGFTTYESVSSILCGSGVDETDCNSIMFSSCGIEYQTVCGRIKGYSYGIVNGFKSVETGIDGVYVDGISITHGSEPRKHIWTYVSGQYETIYPMFPGLQVGGCACTGSADAVNAVPEFVGNDHYCESGMLGIPWTLELHINDPLWDGLGCNGDEGGCCENVDQPWFCKQLPEPTTDDIEVRACAQQEGGNPWDDVVFELIELYIQ